MSELATDRAGRVLVIGGSRGIGAACALRFGVQAARVEITYHRHAARAAQVSEAIRAGGGHAVCHQADVCDPASMAQLAQRLRTSGAALDAIILCASGGLEMGAADDYADRINSKAPLCSLLTLAPVVANGANAIYLTSHEAHFHGVGDSYGPYDRIAASKKAGETALLAELPKLNALGLVLKIVSADLVEDSYTAKILERADPGQLARRRDDVGRLPRSDDVAAEVLRRFLDHSASGATSYIWEPDARYDGRPRHAIRA